jgi:uncharacterized membrane protein
MHATFTKGRLEAFSDGVIAIIITIMVLEMKVPHEHADLAGLRPLMPVFLSYVLSFVYVGIYWNNHHHLLHAARRIDARVLWANLHLLFWLSLIPFVTGWMGENNFAHTPTALYGVVLLCCGGAYVILQRSILRLAEPDAPVAREIGRDVKGKISPVLYAIGIGLAFINSWAAGVFYAGVALMWFIPDRRLARAAQKESGPGSH